jgi:hypothetical protein
MKARQNFLKHADRDPDPEIESISADALSTHICGAIINFSLVTGSWTKAMSLFFSWYLTKNPEFLKDEAEGEFITQIKLLKQVFAELSHEEDMFLLRNALKANYPEIFAREPPGLGGALRRMDKLIPGWV